MKDQTKSMIEMSEYDVFCVRVNKTIKLSVKTETCQI